MQIKVFICVFSESSRNSNILDSQWYQKPFIDNVKNSQMFSLRQSRDELSDANAEYSACIKAHVWPRVSNLDGPAVGVILKDL